MKTALLALPTVHINGTSGKYLLQVNRAALTAVQEPIARSSKRVRNICLHAIDSGNAA